MIHTRSTQWGPRWPRRVAGRLLPALLLLVTSVPGALAAQSTPGHHAAHPPAQSASATSATPAAALRAALNNLLQEHVYLAGAATGAALGGRQAEFQAAADALDANSIALSQAIGSVYGPAAETAFLPLWRAHITMFVDYTQAVAAGDQARRTRALADLDNYRRDFDALVTGANPNLPRGAVAELLGPHVLQLASVIDAQAAGNMVQAYTLLREAAHHMAMIADPLAEAIVRQFPDRFGIVFRLATRAESALAQGRPVEIRQFAFNPSSVQVPVGATVMWTNADAIEHSVTHGTPGLPGGAFDSDFFSEGQSFSFTFGTAGEYAYFCRRHPSMQGRIEVVTS